MLPSVGAEGTGRKLLGLFLFGGIFLALFALLGIEIGFGSPAMPDGAVVVVEDAPPGVGTISLSELRKAVRQRASSAGSEVPEPGSDEYEALEQETLSEFVSAIWLAGQAAELGLPIPKQGGRPDLTKLQEAIEPKLREEAPDPANPQPYFTEVDFKFLWKWLPRTRCRDGFVFDMCAEFVSGHPSSPCFEAAPQEPADECPAAVVQRAVVQPGTVTEREPGGKQLLQGPVPE